MLNFPTPSVQKSQGISTLPSDAVLTQNIYSPFSLQKDNNDFSTIVSLKVAVATGQSAPTLYQIINNTLVVTVDYAETAPTLVDIYTFSGLSISIPQNGLTPESIANYTNPSKLTLAAEKSIGPEVLPDTPPTL